MNNCTVHTSTVCKGGGEYGVIGGPQTDKTPAESPFTSFYIALMCRYDGEGPDAYFWAGKTGQPSRNGFQIADEKESQYSKALKYFTFSVSLCYGTLKLP
jgi:hypothetical protein